MQAITCQTVDAMHQTKPAFGWVKKGTNTVIKTTIHVIWDAAAYHRCDTVKQWMSHPECRIHLTQLPAYCHT